MSTSSTVARLEARLPSETHALLKRAADIQGRSLTDFVVSAAREEAARVVEQNDIIRLSVEDSVRFAELMINPPEPAPAMRRARERHDRLIRSR